MTALVIRGSADRLPLPDSSVDLIVTSPPYSALVAHAFGRVGISNDLSHDYSRLAAWRTTDRGELARVLGVSKPPQQVDGQADLFGGAA